jgi:hypothetical protein
MRRHAVLTFVAVLGVGAMLAAGEARAQTQSKPKPVAPPVKTVQPPTPTAQPPAQIPPAAQPAPAQPLPAAVSAAPEAPSEATLGIPFYPGMQFIESYNAGAGQRYFLFGTVSSFADVVAYYKSVLKQKGELVFEVPATHEFDIGRFNEETMAFPPSVTVKDYTGVGLQGYPNPKAGAEPARFKTVVQIVPIPPVAPIKR